MGRPKSVRVKATAESPQAQLDGFMAKHLPEVAAEARAALVRMRRLLAGAVELVYEKYKGLVIGFRPSERASDAAVSIVLFPRWITLGLLQDGPKLPDPDGLLKGTGTRVRHIRLASARELDRPAIRMLSKEGRSRVWAPIDAAARRRLAIRSVSAKQRPRRPT